ncbi:MAG: hypothetical protein O3B95_06665 [Chloroflexi bacterium]|nr:hypothetical protein [Chloroflexota bacterium]
MTNVIRLAFERLGHAFDTRLVSPKEMTQARLLGDQVARHSHYHVIKAKDARGTRAA